MAQVFSQNEEILIPLWHHHKLQKENSIISVKIWPVVTGGQGYMFFCVNSESKSPERG